MGSNSKRLQLFLLPFAGGSSVSFRRLESLLDERIETITIEYSGRLSRRDEDFISEYDEFLYDVAKQIEKNRNSQMPYALFGYSLGSIIAYDLLSNKMVDGHAVHAFICAKGSPIGKTRTYDYRDKPNEYFIDKIMALGGTDERLFKDNRFLEAYMRPIKADLVIWGKYRYKYGRIPCNTTAIYSDMDPESEGVSDWSLLVDGSIDFYEIGDNHFFIQKYWQKVAAIVNDHLDKYVDSSNSNSNYDEVE